MNAKKQPNCPDCQPGFDRRDFVRSVAMGGVALAGGSSIAITGKVLADTPKPLIGPMPRVVNSVAEDLVKELYSGLTDDQKKAVVKPWDSPARKTVNPNKALDKTLKSVYSKTQQELVERIVKAISSDDKGWHQITRAGTWDASKTFDNTGADIFGDPLNGKFAFLFTGHHLTVRCDGDSESNVAFGGPIYYGHTPNGYKNENVFAYQTKQAMEVFNALDAKQQTKAMIAKDTPGEGSGSIKLVKEGPRPGIAYADLSKDQQELLVSVMKCVLSPFRQADGAEVMTIIKQTGGMDKVHMAFYADEYEGSKTSKEQPWSFWRIEGPGIVWNFRVLPHVHTFVRIGVPA